MKQKTAEIKEFGYLSGIMLIIIFGLILPLLFGHVIGTEIKHYVWLTTPAWPWVSACVIWLLSIMSPILLYPLYFLWMRLSHVLGWINTHLILIIIFFLLMLPISLLLRVFKRQDKQPKSFRIESADVDKNHLKRPF